MMIATLTVTANSRIKRPTMPDIKRIGRNTAISDTVIEMMVNATSRRPSTADCRRDLPISRCRTMFSMTTMASSTTKPTAIARPMIDRLSRL